ncbi:MAG: SPASM domain-containing protein [Clostridia bacterium]|nr:SPASM domain-containing protein [Clostridia bacterium]
MKNLVLLVKPAAGLCNMNCRYCFYRSASGSRENRIMQKETVDKLISRVAEYEPSSLCVMFQGGEPTLAGLDFFEYFVSKTKKNISVPVSYSLQTNGLLVDDAFAKFFKKNNFLLGVSLDGGRKTNDRYRVDKNGNGVLPQIMNSISVLNKHRVDFNILSVVDDENAKDIENTFAYFRKHGFGFLQFIPFIDEGNGVSLSAESFEMFLKKSFDLWYEDYINSRYISIRHIDNYINILLGRPPESCAMCGTCGHYFVVEANGDIYPCDFYCRDEYKLGNVSDDSPFEISEKHKGFIEESFLIHQNCKTCKYYILCRGGCKRDRINGFTENKYCGAYYAFFEYASDRMREIAQNL